MSAPRCSAVPLATALLLLVVIPPGVSTPAAADEHVHVDRGDGGMVVSDTAVASRIGRDMILQGGNAVDAAVATAFALAVSWPEAGNIGGGGFMIVRPADGRNPVCIDYRETAPLSMHARSFTRDDTTFSRKAVGVPGTVRGLAAAHERYGKLPWRDVVMPAARLAAAGITVDTPLARSLNAVLQRPEVKNDDRFAELRRVYGKLDGSPWQVGERLLLPELSETLTTIAKEGPDAFYTGRIAELLVQEMQRGNGEISLEDLKRYRAKVRPAMQGSFRGYTIIGAPPPSSGGTCVIEALNVLEHFDLASRDRFDPVNIHLIAETCRRVFADRARYLGDPDFADIPDHLTSKQHAEELAASINRNRATPSEKITPDIPLVDESEDTTHFSVIDGDGMAVSNTYTLEASWGSRHVVTGAGFVLNNEMGDFNWFPGETNRKGRIGTQANTVAPGKRMLSSQTPTMVEKDGELVLITGTPGGRTIINTVICIVLGVTEFEMDAAEAVAIPRLHHQWFPDQLELERLPQPPHATVADALRDMGHTVKNRAVQGSAHTIQIDPSTGIAIGVADYRRGGRPAAVASNNFAVWDFGEVQGTLMSDARATGQQWDKWDGDVADAQTDGLDHLRIDASLGKTPSPATIALSDPGTFLAAEVKLDAVRLGGQVSDESLTIGVMDADQGNIAIASLSLQRDVANRIVVAGKSPHDDSEGNIAVIADSATLENLLVRLEVDAHSGKYRVMSRPAAEPLWTIHGRGEIASDVIPGRVRIAIDGDWSDEDEFIDIDRIAIESR